MGANGAGKSTLVKILTGAVRPDTGRIRHPRPRAAAHSPAEARRSGIVSVYQEPSLIPDLDIRSNLRLTRYPVEQFRHWVSELGLAKLDLSRPGSRIATRLVASNRPGARSCVEPDVLMLDEMTAALPANLTERVLEVIGRQRGGERSVDLHLAPHDRDRCGVRPRHRPARRRDSRRRRRHRGIGRADRRADAWRDGRRTLPRRN